jgi:Flp pilus assembly protein TadG
VFLSTRRSRDSGSASLEIAILGPVVLLLTFTIIQAGLWFYARSLALAAAEEGVAAGRAYGATTDAGPGRARTFLAEQAGDSLLVATVSGAGTTATVVRIEVGGRSLSVLPGTQGIAIRQVAEAERERFTTPGAP